MLISTDSEYLKWYADNTASWFRRQLKRQPLVTAASMQMRLGGTDEGIPFGFRSASPAPVQMHINLSPSGWVLTCALALISE